MLTSKGTLCWKILLLILILLDNAHAHESSLFLLSSTEKHRTLAERVRGCAVDVNVSRLNCIFQEMQRSSDIEWIDASTDAFASIMNNMIGGEAFVRNAAIKASKAVILAAGKMATDYDADSKRGGVPSITHVLYSVIDLYHSIAEIERLAEQTGLSTKPAEDLVPRAEIKLQSMPPLTFLRMTSEFLQQEKSKIKSLPSQNNDPDIIRFGNMLSQLLLHKDLELDFQDLRFQSQLANFVRYQWEAIANEKVCAFNDGGDKENRLKGLMYVTARLWYQLIRPDTVSFNDKKLIDLMERRIHDAIADQSSISIMLTHFTVFFQTYELIAEQETHYVQSIGDALVSNYQPETLKQAGVDLDDFGDFSLFLSPEGRLPPTTPPALGF